MKQYYPKNNFDLYGLVDIRIMIYNVEILTQEATLKLT